MNARARARWVLMVAAGAAITLGWLSLTHPELGFYLDRWEGWHYTRVALHPLQAPRDAHYGFRLLPAVLAGRLPFDLLTSYLIINQLSLVVASCATLVVALRMGVSPGLAAVCAVQWLAMPGAAKWLMAFTSCPDAFYLMLLAVGLAAVQRGGRGWVTAVMTLGMLTKVTVVVLWPAWLCALASAQAGLPTAWWRPGPWLRRLPWARASLVCVPGVVAAGVIRGFFPAAPDGYSLLDDIGGTVEMKFLWTSAMWPGVLPQVTEYVMGLFIAYGVLAMVCLWRWRDTAAVLSEQPVVATYTLGSLLLSFMGSYDEVRAHVYHAAGLIPLAALVLQRQPGVLTIPAHAVTLLLGQVLLSDLAFADVVTIEAYMPHYMGPAAARWMLCKLLTAGVLVGVVLKAGRAASVGRGGTQPA